MEFSWTTALIIAGVLLALAYFGKKLKKLIGLALIRNCEFDVQYLLEGKLIHRATLKGSEIEKIAASTITDILTEATRHGLQVIGECVQKPTVNGVGSLSLPVIFEGRPGTFVVKYTRIRPPLTTSR